MRIANFAVILLFGALLLLPLGARAADAVGGCTCKIIHVDQSATDGSTASFVRSTNEGRITQSACQAKEESYTRSCGDKCTESASCTFVGEMGKCTCSYIWQTSSGSPEKRWHTEEDINAGDCRVSVVTDKVKKADEYISYMECSFDVKVKYCCFRDKRDGVEREGYYKDRQCSVSDFPDKPKLSDDKYTVTDMPSSGKCADAPGTIKTVDYCCCRQGRDCQKLNGYYDDRQCGSNNFPDQQKLEDSAYTSHDLPAIDYSIYQDRSNPNIDAEHRALAEQQYQEALTNVCRQLDDTSPLVDYCCCRVVNNKQECVNTQGYLNNRTCSTLNFPGQDKLADNAYVVRDFPASKQCADFNRVFPTTPDVVKTLQTDARSLNKLSERLNTPQAIIGQGIKVLMAFMGSIALALYVYSGVLWMTAMGNAEQTGKAKTVIVWTTLGLFVMLASYLLTDAIFSIIR